LNCTPDSFSDGGKFVNDQLNIAAAVQHALTMVEDGASIIDVGGESTRPGAHSVPVDVEIARTVPVIEQLSQHGVTISIDTMKAEVMRRAIEAGATMVNDVTALTGDQDSLAVVAEAGVDICLMHMQGRPETMQEKPDYRNVVVEVSDYLSQRIEACLKAGVSESSIMVDPGIGFGKRLEDNLDLIAGIEILKSNLALPVLMGVSRKSFLGAITGADVDAREVETAAAVSICAYAGADLLRVHDVEMQSRAVAVGSRLRDACLRLS
ncbi:MAG TPA: dihydropteroate synthase, partial [Mariprofundaceae bacterium]|nr:dihydropteroate synthase [Mariprofundaceae bacterium]